ncbi:MAG: phosphodiester glycosidase family protein [Planctomycetaceae bacterium]|nr:phosphodiester glycosidase family protein [Planctomycetaceae bacterium]
MRTTFIFLILSISGFVFADESWQKTDWTPIFQGIDTATGQADVPRLMRVYAMRIDLKADGIGFFSTPRAEDGFDFKVKETVRETVPQFLEKHALQAAFNANFYSPFSAQTIRTSGPSVLRGLAVSQGQIVSKNEKGWPVFLVFKDNRAEIADIQEEGTEPPDEVETAVAGNRILVDQGVVVQQTNQDVHPRTAVGVSQDSHYVYFVVIDGRQPGYSDGASYRETGQWLVLFGAWNGINLDGGGSTTMAIRSAEGKAKVLNTPSGQDGNPTNYRHNGNSIGIRAKLLAP